MSSDRRFFQGALEADYVGIELEDAPAVGNHYRNQLTRAVIRDVVELPALPTPPPEPGHSQNRLDECFFELAGEGGELHRCALAQLHVYEVEFSDVVQRDGRVYGRMRGRVCAELLPEPVTVLQKLTARIERIPPLRERSSGCLPLGCGALGCSSGLGLLALLGLATLAPTCSPTTAASNWYLLLGILLLCLLPVLYSSLFGLFTGNRRQQRGSGCGLLLLLGLSSLLLHPDCQRTPTQLTQVAQQLRDLALDESASARVLRELQRFFPQESAKRMTVDQALAKPETLFEQSERSIYISNDTLFLSGSSILLRPISPELERLGELLRKQRASSVTIEGHADAIGKAKDNLELSRRRAARVRDWLIENAAIRPERLQVKALGSSQPVVRAPLTDEAQSPNRRVEVRAVMVTAP